MRFLTIAEVTTQGLREVLANVDQPDVDAVRKMLFPLDPSQIIETARALNRACYAANIEGVKGFITQDNAARHIADLANRLADHFGKAAA